MWLIIGYGNPLRGDDGAGPLLAGKLAEQLSAAQAKIIIAHQLTPELALEIAAAKIHSVLFIDATREQSTAVDIFPLIPDANGSCGHQVAPQLLLQLAEQLYDRAVPGWLLTITGEDFSFTEQRSAAAEKNSTAAFRHAIEFIQNPKILP